MYEENSIRIAEMGTWLDFRFASAVVLFRLERYFYMENTREILPAYAYVCTRARAFTVTFVTIFQLICRRRWRKCMLRRMFPSPRRTMPYRCRLFLLRAGRTEIGRHCHQCAISFLEFLLKKPHDALGPRDPQKNFIISVSSILHKDK